MDILRHKLEEPGDKSYAIELSQQLILNAESVHVSEHSFLLLVAHLFKLSCCKLNGEKILQTCETGLKKIFSLKSNKNDAIKIANIFSEMIREIIIDEMVDYPVQQVITNLKLYLNVMVGENLKLDDFHHSDENFDIIVDVIGIFLNKENKNFSWYFQSVQMLEKCCRVGYECTENLDYKYLEGEKYTDFLNCPFSNDWEKYLPFDVEVIKKFLKWNIYVGNTLDLLFDRENKDEDCILAKNEKMDDFEIRKNNKEVDKMDKEEKNLDSSVSKCEDLKTLLNESYAIKNRIQNIKEDFCKFLMSFALFERFQKFYISVSNVL